MQGDAACHAVRSLADGRCVSRASARNRSLFGPPGRAYVYFTYGVHWALNVATQEEGVGEGVLIRAVEPVEGIEEMAKLRGTELADDAKRQAAQVRLLASGPGRLTQAFAIDRELDGHDLSQPPLVLLRGRRVPDDEVGVSKRIGITKAAERMLRFYVKNNPLVSRNRNQR